MSNSTMESSSEPNVKLENISPKEEKQENDATKHVEENKSNVPEVEALNLQAMEPEKCLFPRMNHPAGLHFKILTPDLVDAIIHEQLQLLYRQKQIDFDPDNPQNDQTAMLNFNQLAMLAKNVTQECDKHILEKLNNEVAFQEFLQAHNMQKVFLPKDNQNL